MTKLLFMASSMAALAFGLIRVSRRRPTAPARKKTTTFPVRCQSCQRSLLVDSGRHFADPNDSESFPALVTCPHCGRDHDVAYSPAGAVHKIVLKPLPAPEQSRRHGLWNVGFSGN
jgi:hypothetical protein